MPEGIDCQRCHGPVASHIQAAQAKHAKADDLRAAIVNPARLTASRQLEVCMQCHLETTSMNLPESITRFERRPFSYLPSEPLGSFKTFFDRTPGASQKPFEIAQSAYRLRNRNASTAAMAPSRASLATTRTPPPEARKPPHITKLLALPFRRACQVGDEPNAYGRRGLRGCHMRKRRTSDVIHAVMTDHLIQRPMEEISWPHCRSAIPRTPPNTVAKSSLTIRTRCRGPRKTSSTSQSRRCATRVPGGRNSPPNPRHRRCQAPTAGAIL